MRIMRVMWACFAMLILSIGISSAQSAECPMLVQEILMTVSDVCDETGRNQVCYGNIALTAEGRNDAFKLEDVGDIANLADMQSLSLSPYNEDGGIWGVALMQVQANLPDTLHGQNVTMIAFGDVSLTNTINAPIELSATLSANGRTRSTPTTADGDLNVLTAISSGTSVEVLGRNEAGDWLLIRLPEASISGAQYGWISTQVLSISGDSMGLNIFQDDVLDFGAPPATTPMSAFYLKTGIDTTNCAEMPPDGVLIQTPQGAGRVQMTVNGVQMSFGSTVFLKTVDNLLAVIVIEGTAIITANGKTAFVPAGTESFIPLNEDLTAPVDVPSDPSPYKSVDVLYLPVTDAIQLVSRPVTIIDPPTPDQITRAIRDSFAPNGAIDGLYYFILTEMTMLITPTYTTGFCQEADGTGLGYRARMEFTPTGIISNVGVADGLVRIDEGIWGDPERDHQDLSVLGPSGTEGFASTFYSVSPGVIQEKRSVMTNNNLGQSLCVGIITGTWIAP
ncbi:MAG: hypothetical protein KJ043_06185 [Anaerolineae bacterium]|nr:hypothetical protein [Anaerolineae bacterium]